MLNNTKDILTLKELQKLLHIGKTPLCDWCRAVRLRRSGWVISGGSQKKVSQNISGEWNNISKVRITARNKLLTKFVYKYAFLSKENHQCILTSDLEHDIIESI